MSPSIEYPLHPLRDGTPAATCVVSKGSYSVHDSTFRTRSPDGSTLERSGATSTSRCGHHGAEPPYAAGRNVIVGVVTDVNVVTEVVDVVVTEVSS